MNEINTLMIFGTDEYSREYWWNVYIISYVREQYEKNWMWIEQRQQRHLVMLSNQHIFRLIRIWIYVNELFTSYISFLLQIFYFINNLFFWKNFYSKKRIYKILKKRISFIDIFWLFCLLLALKTLLELLQVLLPNFHFIRRPIVW